MKQANIQDHEHFMALAIEQAKIAESIDEVPVGAVLVLDNKVIGRGYNQQITQTDPSLHAEVIAIREAAKAISNYRLLNTTLYVTLEPCAMCAGLIVHSRIAHVVFATKDYKTGACGSIANIVEHDKLNHKAIVTSGICQQECSAMLSSFFSAKRAKKKAAKRTAAKQPD